MTHLVLPIWYKRDGAPHRPFSFSLPTVLFRWKKRGHWLMFFVFLFKNKINTTRSSGWLIFDFVVLHSFSTWFRGTNWCLRCSSSARRPFLLPTTRRWELLPDKRTKTCCSTISVRVKKKYIYILLSSFQKPLFNKLQVQEGWNV